LLLRFLEFRVDEDSVPLLLPVGSSPLRRQPGLGVFVRREVGGRLPLLDGVGDGHVVGEPPVAALHGRLLTRGLWIETSVNG
jgi:hypothetical protein